MEKSRLDFERDEVVSRASLCVDLFLEAAFLWRVLLSNVEFRALVISLVDSSWPLTAANLDEGFMEVRRILAGSPTKNMMFVEDMVFVKLGVENVMVNSSGLLDLLVLDEVQGYWTVFQWVEDDGRLTRP
ncbi:hypothetical protein U1Q18_036416 [Sarracenia purpurea var. burkii]